MTGSQTQGSPIVLRPQVVLEPTIATTYLPKYVPVTPTSIKTITVVLERVGSREEGHTEPGGGCPSVPHKELELRPFQTLTSLHRNTLKVRSSAPVAVKTDRENFSRDTTLLGSGWCTSSVCVSSGRLQFLEGRLSNVVGGPGVRWSEDYRSRDLKWRRVTLGLWCLVSVREGCHRTHSRTGCVRSRVDYLRYLFFNKSLRTIPTAPSEVSTGDAIHVRGTVTLERRPLSPTRVEVCVAPVLPQILAPHPIPGQLPFIVSPGYSPFP